MENLVRSTGYSSWRENLTDEQIAQRVRETYQTVLNICAEKALRDGSDWRKDNHPSGVASNAQLWVLGSCLGHASTFETDADLEVAKRRMGA